jgi:four helix bundle protein
MDGMHENLAGRTKRFALSVIELYSTLPRTTAAQVLGRQVLRSATSVGAHYREGHRARSTAEFVSKLEGGLQELEETRYWFELLGESGIVPPLVMAPLQDEAEQLTAILVACVKKAKKGKYE